MYAVLKILTEIALILLAIFHFRRRRLYELAAKIPGPASEVPILGFLYNFIGIPIEKFGRVFLDNFSPTEPLQKFWFGTKLVIVPNTPALFKVILTSPDCLQKPSYAYDCFFADKSLISNNGSMQERHRRILSNSMTPAMLNQLNPVFNRRIKRFVDVIGAKVGLGEFNAFDDVAACTLESLLEGNFLFEYDCYDSELLRACEGFNHVAMKRLVQPWLSFKPLFRVSPMARDFELTVGSIHRKIEEILRQNEHLRIDSDRKQGIFISQLLNARHKFSNDEIVDEILVLILTGFETSATTLAACLLLLAMHKDIQQKVIDEIDSLSLDDTFTLSNDETLQFPYIEMVLKETMRLFPVAPIIARDTTADIQLDGHTIPKGMTIALPIYFVQRNELIWGSDAGAFNPGRFESERMKKIHPYAFVPFSGGKRMCLGYKYAMVFMKIFIVNFFKNFKVDTGLKYGEIELQLMLTLSFIQGYPISLVQRKRK